jgi:hypothetical protein
MLLVVLLTQEVEVEEIVVMVKLLVMEVPEL